MSGIRIKASPPTLEVVIARPDAANAIDAATSRELGAAFVRLRDDPALRAAIITGAGDRHFSAGWDLKAAASGEGYESDYGPGGFGGYPELPGLNKPVIAAVNGVAVGGGFELVMAADFVVAADHAQFWLPETMIGLVPDSATVRLARLLPRAIALEVLLAGRRLTASEAEMWGLVNEVKPAHLVVPHARELAENIAFGAPLAAEAVLDGVNAAEHLSITDAYAALRASESYRRAIESDDAIEGVTAAAEKRKPEWKGR